MSLDLSSLEGAVMQLKGALDMYDSELVQNNPQLKKHMRGSAIQAFEFTYELCFKMLSRHLKMSSASPVEIEHMSFSDLVREAYGKNLVRSDLVAWRGYRTNRGTTSHTYNESKAQEVFEGIPDFLDEARYLLGQLQERNKSLD